MGEALTVASKYLQVTFSELQGCSLEVFYTVLSRRSVQVSCLICKNSVVVGILEAFYQLVSGR
uniref:Uncharacterized protein n=1 Tax=Leersia perrieri TaxID=77586 RepID=A0A0D9WJI9_9ORYZ